MEPVCVVTGGSSGIGAAICARFASAGCKVLSVARRPCGASGCDSIIADLSQESSVDVITKEVENRAKGKKLMICLVHCASNYPSDSAHSVDAPGLGVALSLNVVVPAVLTSRLMPYMGAGSSVIFVGSTLSEKAVAGKLSYCTSKHAMVGLMRAVAQDILWSGVHTVLVCPGITDTAMVRDAVAGREQEFGAFVRDLQGRVLTPEEVARVVWDAAQAPVLHGAIIHCNNGQRER